MTDDLNKMRQAFRQEQASGPHLASRNAAIQAAMEKFELQESENNSASRQGTGLFNRLNQQVTAIAASFLRRFSMTRIHLKLPHLLAGGVSLAALALAVNLNSDVQYMFRPNTDGSAEPSPVLESADMREQESLEQRVVSPQTSVPSPGPMYGPGGLDGVGSSELVAAPPAEYRPPSLAAKPVERVLQRTRTYAAKATSGARSESPSVATISRDQGRDRFSNVPDNPVKRVADDPVSTFSADIDTASYSFVRKALSLGSLPPKDAVRVEEMINYFDYDYPLPAGDSEPFRADVTIMPTPWNAETRLMRIGVKGYDIERASAPTANLVFLIDTSGSMEAPDKLPLLRQAFKMLVNSLRPDDRVAIVTYAGSAGTVLEPTKASESGKILSALDDLSAGGSTAGAEGIRQAYQLAEREFEDEGINRVILATDGDFNVGISNPEQLKDFVERKRDTGVTLSVLGFGRGNYNDALMQELVQNGNGNAAYIDTVSEARKVLVDEASSTLFPIAKDVKFQVEFNPENVSEYRLIGYESRNLKREDFNNDKVDAGDIGAGHTVTAIYEYRPSAATGALIEPLRYKADSSPAQVGATDEIAFLKIRYKLPGEDKSRLISTPIGEGQMMRLMSEASDDTRFAVAVAAFGQLLKGGQYTGSYTYDDVLALARPARGEDLFNYRGSFLELVQLAKSADAMAPLKQ